MGLLIVSVITLVVGLLLMYVKEFKIGKFIIKNKTFDYFDDSMFGAIITTVSGIVIVTIVVSVICINASMKSYRVVAVNNVLTIQSSLKNENITEKERMSTISDINQYNYDIETTKLYHDNFWIGAFYDKWYLTQTPIDVSLVPTVTNHIVINKDLGEL